MFVTFQIIWWLALVVILLLISERRHATFAVLALIGAVMLFEVHHLITALRRGAYYPGLATGLLFPPLAWMYWRELLRAWRHGRGAAGRR